MRINFAPFETISIILVTLIVVAAGLLVFGLTEDHPGAWMILGGLLTLALAGLGAGVVVFIMWVSYRMERGRMEADQRQFVANANEELKALRDMAHAQNAQARAQAAHQRALLTENRDLRRALPEPTETVDAITFDAALFEELDWED